MTIGVKILSPPFQRYSNILNLQQQLNHRLQTIPNFPSILLLLEHYPVYTAGRRIKQPESTTTDITNLKELNADVEYIDRGGQWTFHGPGQLIGYPIVNLRHALSTSPKCYVDSLENAIIQTCQQLGIKGAGRRLETGIWIDGKRKIGAIGIQISRHCTMHGFALNCNVDLSWFNHIVPCGITNLGVTSLSQELGRDVKCSEVSPIVIEKLSAVWKRDIQPLSRLSPSVDAWIDSMLTTTDV